MRRLLIIAALGLWATALVVASAGPARPPRLLSETGLYVTGGLKASSTGDAMTLDPRNRPYSPQYSLWTDGARKSRWVRLPDGATIDVSNADAWTFPAGTKFWKEFAFGGRKVETRLLWKTGEHPSDWMFGVYVWNDTQTEAVLAPEEGIPSLVEVAPGKRHSIPGIVDCRACHDGTRTEVLGFTALQLSTDRDANAPHAEPLTDGMMTVKTLIDEHLVQPVRSEWASRPPRIDAENAATRTVLGYLSANCGHCHNAQSGVANGSLNLRQPSNGSVLNDSAVAHALGRSTAWQIPGTDEGGSVAIKPGAPELSAILQRMRSRRPSSQMPPLGTVTQDSQAIKLIENWILALP